MNDYRAVSYPQRGVSGQTGSWRSHRPVVDTEKCVHCQICWIFCPDASMDRHAKVDLTYCKGCGICAKECPAKAITMEEEAATCPL